MSFYAPARIGLMWRTFLTTVIYIEVFFCSLFPKLHNTGFITAGIRSSHRMCSIKKAGLENFAIWTGKPLSRSFFLIKLLACNFISFNPATLSKTDSSTGVFLWILQNFQEHLHWKTSTNGFRIFSTVKSTYSGAIFCDAIFWNVLFILENYNRAIFRILSNN